MVIQLLICTCIYFFILFIRSNETYFSKKAIEVVSNALSYDINLKKIYNSCNEYLKGQKFLKLDENIETNTIEQKVETNNNENSTEVVNNENEEKGMGGEEIQPEQMPETNKSNMELDAEYIKNNYSLVIPVNGNITSGFGNREPTEIISAFHQGVDIGAVVRHAYMCFYGGNCYCCIKCRGLWKSYKNTKW